VKMVMTREEVFQATRPAAASVITVKAGITKEGLLTALSARAIYDFGASTGMPGWDKMLGGIFRVFSMYRVPNFKIALYDVVTNKAPSGPYRAPSAAQVTFALESEMDLLARAVKMDPLEFRFKNAVAEGDLMADGTPYPRIGFKETLEKMRQYLDQRPISAGDNRGRGIACGVWNTGNMGTGANIHINPDGSLVLVLGCTDVSGSRTTLAQMVAEEFGVPLSSVRVVLGDTETAPFATIAAGSITTRSSGSAVYRACQDAKEKLIQRAALQMDIKPEALELFQGQVRMKEMPEKQTSIADLVRERFGFPGFGPILGQGAGENQAKGTPVFVVESAEVEVDKETGKVKVLSFAAAQDTGLALNPRILEGQIQGALAQGIGWALSEYYVLQKGKMVNATFQDYRMPTAADVPFMDAMLVEVNSRAEPYGIRGAGEPPIVPTLAAIANAVHSAIGVRFKELPLTPEVVLHGISQLTDR
jgi:xanthine dehydrogenase molybdenum-binding subunit